MDPSALLLAAALSLPTTGLPMWDGASSQALEEAASMPAPQPEAQAPRTLKPMKVPQIKREKEGARDPREGRDFRRIPGRSMGPVGTPCPDGSDSPCQETPYPTGNPPLGGYYYGLYRGDDGKLHYGRLYLPNYGPFEGQAHNELPPLGYPAQLALPEPMALPEKAPAKKPKKGI